MIIIKLGGSLTDTALLKAWLFYLAKMRVNKAIIVPGGGGFAEQVRTAQRQWRFSDQTAHTMALLAMQQMALLFQGINQHLHLAGSRNEICDALKRRNTVIWSPDIRWLEQSQIEASWDVTSDSLAAWLAAEMSAQQLILVKSVQISDEDNFRQLIDKGIVDKAFCRFVDKVKFDIRLYNRNDLTLFKTRFN